MKITSIRHDKDAGREMMTVYDADVLMEKMKTETRDGYVTGLRTIIPQLEGTESAFSHIDKLPRVYPAVECARTKDGGRRMKRYNGLVQLEVKKLAGLAEAELVKRQAMLLPQTFAAFCGSSGKSVKIWVCFALPDGNLPKREQEAALFHAHAYRLAVSCYQPLFPFPITLKEPSLMQSCRMTLDEHPGYNPHAVPFCLEQPFSMPGEQTFRQRQLAEKNPLLRLEPGFETSQTFTMLFETALDKALRDMENWRRGNNLQPLLVRLAEYCYKAGIPEEEVVRQTIIHYYAQAEQQTVRAMVHNIYQESKGFGSKTILTPEQDTALRLEEFMERRYEFRYNTVLNDLEYRQRNSIHFYFRPVDRRVRNTVAINALKEGIRAWDRDVERYLTSEYVSLYNPVEEYLCSVGRWDGKDRIRALANLVPCNNPHWRELFYRWFLSMVAHWRGLDRQHGNSTSPLLVGAQGYRKSTYCRIILPPELRFGYTDSLDFKSKQDAERYLGRFLLVNLDEFDQISSNQQGFLKHLLQKPVANLRKPYGSTIQEVRRYASFIGTSNQMDLLTDPSGSRRFICIEVTAPIDTNVTINYKQLYAQAMDAIYKGERYWLNDEDEAILKETNRDFEQVSPLEQLFHCYFRVTEEEREGEWLTAMEIFNYLQQKTRDKLSVSKIGHFGRSLKKLDIPCKKSNRGTMYHLVRLG